MAGAARNALDCALWDLDAKLTGQPAWKTAGLARLDRSGHLRDLEPGYAAGDGGGGARPAAPAGAEALKIGTAR